MAAALSNGGLNFGTLIGPLKDIHCSYAGTTQPYATATYSCQWSQGDTEVKAQNGRWEVYDGKAARLSEGGEAGGPPTTNEEASSRASTVYAKRAGGSAKCSRILSDEIDGHKLSMTQAHAWSCLVLNSYGDAIEPQEGELLREEWEWNADGSVARETIDFSSTRQELEERATSGDESTETSPKAQEEGQGTPSTESSTSSNAGSTENYLSAPSVRGTECAGRLTDSPPFRSAKGPFSVIAGGLPCASADADVQAYLEWRYNHPEGHRSTLPGGLKCHSSTYTPTGHREEESLGYTTCANTAQSVTFVDHEW